MAVDSHFVKAVGTMLVIVALVSYAVYDNGLKTDTFNYGGQTMGTSYTVKANHAGLSRAAARRMRKSIDATLRRINRQMSTYDPESEIARFNHSRSTTPIEISGDFAHVMRFALRLAQRTGGAFDPTVGPLVNLWGFGPDGKRNTPPTEAEILEARKIVGHERVTLYGGRRLQKKTPELQLDLAAVAKGYAVDDIGRVLLRAGVRNFLVEVGGETLAFGHNQDGEKWRVGVQRPDYDSAPGEVLQGIVHLSGTAVATSGDYQNYFRGEGGQVFAHIIDPRTAKPAAHTVASVSVVADDCLTADGLATALFVMGSKAGLRLIEGYPYAEALFVIRNEDGTFSEISSSGFSKMTGYETTKEEE